MEKKNNNERETGWNWSAPVPSHSDGYHSRVRRGRLPVPVPCGGQGRTKGNKPARWPPFSVRREAGDASSLLKGPSLGGCLLSLLCLSLINGRGPWDEGLGLELTSSGFSDPSRSACTEVLCPPTAMTEGCVWLWVSGLLGRAYGGQRVGPLAGSPRARGAE